MRAKFHADVTESFPARELDGAKPLIASQALVVRHEDRQSLTHLNSASDAGFAQA